jgi:enoyl-CoA hydratase/3-hydroxyacyl-CoA dehydrogenase
MQETRLNNVIGHLSMNPVKGKTGPAVSVVSTAYGVGVIQMNFPPVNSLHPIVMEGLQNAYKECINNPDVKAIVITGAGKFFMAGADIPNIARMQAEAVKTGNVEGLRNYLRAGHQFINTLEKGSKPVVAAVNGPALGGGCELAMACNARVALKSAKFGLPELNLGIIPGLGGTQRLPRLVGLQQAVKMTLSGRPINAKKAMKVGLADAVVKKYKDLLPTAVKLALAIASGQQPRRMSLYLNDKIGPIPEGQVIIEGARLKSKRKAPNVSHPGGYLDAALAGLQNGGLAGIEKEIEVFTKLAPGVNARALVHMFLASKVTSKIPGINVKKQSAKVGTVAVIGAGTMGAGIVLAFLRKGFHVIVKEYNQEALEIGVKRIVNLIARLLKKMRQNPMALEYLMRNLTAQTTYDGFDKADMVIEAAVENIKIKQQIFATLEKICSPTCVLATNTSTIDIEIVAQATNAIDRIIGLHFFSPAHIMPLLEIIKTDKTSDVTLATAVNVAKKIGKTPVVVGNCVAFTANRIFFPYGQAAAMLLERGADPYAIDKALESFGMPMGVFKMADLSGIDIFLHVGGIISSAYGERCYLSTANKYMVTDKRLGQKTGKGFYVYKKNKPVPDGKALTGYVASAARDANITAAEQKLVASLTAEEFVQICLYTVANESFRVLDEGMVYREADIDIVSIYGYGFPAYRGGIMFWARSEGLSKIVATLNKFSQVFGKHNPKLKSFFAPCARLQAEARK